VLLLRVHELFYAMLLVSMLLHRLLYYLTTTLLMVDHSLTLVGVERPTAPNGKKRLFSNQTSFV
jgi:hypothetical protein